MPLKSQETVFSNIAGMKEMSNVGIVFDSFIHRFVLCI